MTLALLDEVILSLCQSSWLKVARIIGDADRDERLAGIDRDERMDAVADRIAALVDAGKLESNGDLDEWRLSEIRLIETSA